MFKLLWSLKALPCALYFGWRVMLEKIPTKEALVCVLCEEQDEIISHLLLTCTVAKKNWKKCDG